MTKIILVILVVLALNLRAQKETVLSDSVNVLFVIPDPRNGTDSMVWIKNNDRYTTDWKVYYDKNKKRLAYESFLNVDTCTTFDFWRNGKLKKKTKHVKDTTYRIPGRGVVFHWYYEETYCLNGQLTYKGYPNKRSPQHIVTYHCTGKKKTEYTSNADNKGLYTLWYDNGQKQEEGCYKNGTKEGVWTYWTKAGKPEKKEKYANGKLVEEIK